MDDKLKATDLLGLKPYGEAIKIAVEKGFDGAAAVLSRICLPAAEELGLWFKDKIRFWRLNNLIKILEKSKGKITFDNSELQIHPRVIHGIMEEGSWCEDSILQDMWAGLLVSSCSTQVPNDENMLFVNTLKGLTSSQAKIIQCICTTCNVRFYNDLFIEASAIVATPDQLLELTGLTSIQRIDWELDNLSSLSLLTGINGPVGGFAISASNTLAQMKPTAFLLNLYARTQGFTGGLMEFYKLQNVMEAPQLGIMPPVYLSLAGV